MITAPQVNDESWQISVGDLDLQSEGRYIACALVERVRGFDTPRENSNVIKTSFPLISGDKTIITQIEMLSLDDVRVPYQSVDHARFFKDNQNNNCLAVRWMIDTMKQLRSLNILHRLSTFSITPTIQTDPQTQKQILTTSNILVGCNQQHDKAFMFSRIVKQ